MDSRPPNVAMRIRQALAKMRHNRFLRFLVVGGLNTIFGYGVFAAVYVVTNDYRIAIVVATAIGIVFNFFSTGRVVFGNRSIRAALPFALGYGAVLILNLLLAEIFVAAGTGALSAQALALPIVVLASFFINARLVFKPQSRV